MRSLKHFIYFATRLTIVIKFINIGKNEDEYELVIPRELTLMIYNKFYKVLIAKEIIYNKLRWTLNCEECLQFNWIIKLSKIPCYADDYYIENYSEHYDKLVCKNGCNYKLNCGHNIIIYPEDYIDKIMDIECEICENYEIKKNIWYGISASALYCGTLIGDDNYYM